jgi:hypothetical protein
VCGGPKEADQFAGDGRHGLVVLLASCPHPAIAPAETDLGFPGQLLDLLGLPLEPASYDCGASSRMPIGPGSFRKHAAHMGIASLGNRSASVTLAAGVQRRHEADETHQVPSAIEARQLSKLGDNRGGRQIRYTAMCRESTDHMSLGPFRDQLLNLLTQTFYTGRRLLDRTDVLLEADLLARVLEPLLAEPTQMHPRPRAAPRMSAPVA